MTRWPVTGRTDELRQLTTALTEQRGAVITGPAGVGKTTLAMACLQAAEDRGMSVAHTTATHASRELPFGAFASFLPPDPVGPVRGPGDLSALLSRYGQALVDRAGRSPLVVFVDDAHLLDDGSATLVHQLALQWAATVLATVREGEMAPDAVVALWKDGPAERIELGVLDDADIEELLMLVLDGPVDAVSVRQLSARCRGNPLVLRELVTGALESGALTSEGGIWQLRAALRPTARLVELVALRLGDLSGPERELMELLALCDPLDQAEPAQLVDQSSLERLELKGLVRSRSDGRRIQVWLGHPVYGDVVRDGISALRKRTIARSLADVLQATGARRRGDTLLLASLRLTGGGGSARLLEDGAAAARGRHEFSLAERLARAAIDEGAGFEARFVAAEAAHAQGRREQAEHELAGLATDAVSDAERTRVALVRFDNSFFVQGRADFRLIDDELESIRDPQWRDELLARRLYVMSFRSGPRAAVDGAREVLQRPHAGPLTAAHVAVSHCLGRLGRLNDAIQLRAPPSGSAAMPSSDAPWEEWSIFVARVGPLTYAGRLAEAEELVTLAYGRIVDTPWAEAKAYVAAWFAVVHLEQGRPMSAFRRASESYTLFQRLGRPYRTRWPTFTAAHALATAGQGRRAAEMLAALDALAFPTSLINETDLIQARAWTAAAGGDLPTARDLLERAADLGEEIGDLIGSAAALHGLARLGRARQVAERLAHLANHVEGELVAARSAYASALAGRDCEALAEVSRDFEHLGALLYAAEARAEVAVLLRRAGDARKATSAEHQSARLLARCEGAATPPVRLITAHVRLTPGELDAALKASEGHANKQIAADLHLSVRTVENRLQRVYEKLGVSGRHQLGDALRDLPTT